MNRDIKERTISRNQAMQILGLGRHQIRRIIDNGQLQCFRVGDTYRLYPEQVEKLRKEREQENHAAK